MAEMTRVFRGYRFRLKLKADERAQVTHIFAGRRKAWNWALALAKEILASGPAEEEEPLLDERTPAESRLEKGTQGKAPVQVGVKLLISESKNPAMSGTHSGKPRAKPSQAKAKVSRPHHYIDHFTLIRLFGSAKASLDWTPCVPTKVFEIALGDLVQSLRAYFKSRGQARASGFPSFIPARDGNSFTVSGVIRAKYDEKHHRWTIDLPGLDPLRICGSASKLLSDLKLHHGEIKEATISEKDGKYFLCVLIERDAKSPLLDPSSIAPYQRVGVDVGLTTFATLSNGEAIANPRFGRRRQTRTHHLGQSIGRSQSARALIKNVSGVLPPKSHRQQVKEDKLRSSQGKLHDTRQTFVHQQSAKLVPRIPALGVEDLAIANLMRNHCVASSFADASIGSFIGALECRAEDLGTYVVKADRFFPSSQLCSACGYQNQDLKGLKGLKIRAWKCPVCHTAHKRDPNASVNLIPSPAQLIQAHQDRLDKMAAYQKQRERVSQRGKKAGETNHQKALARQAKQEQRALAAAQSAEQAEQTSILSQTPLSQTPPHSVPGPDLAGPGPASLPHPPTTTPLPVLGNQFKTDVDPIPGESKTENCAWRLGKPNAGLSADHNPGLLEESRTEPSRRTTSLGTTGPPA